ncbi:hypothetical protein ATCC90586_010905 [Pythium insidiosum]|nr:hypothetical protein ATCC90586_010905 [Pythium insidiosum]
MIDSCRGPTPTGLIKPDLSAPGVRILSASIKDDSEYKTRTGTSLAAPHVAGTIVLMLSAHPEYNYDQVLAKLRESAATKSLQPSGFECGGTPDTVFPNNQYGSGRLSAARAMGLSAPDEKPATMLDPCARMRPEDCAEANKCQWNPTNGNYGKCEPRPTADDNGSFDISFAPGDIRLSRSG